MKTVLSLLALSFLSTACGAVETDREGSYRIKGEKNEYCIKSNGGVCDVEKDDAPVKKEPECVKRADTGVVVFNIVGTSDEEINECEKEEVK